MNEFIVQKVFVTRIYNKDDEEVHETNTTLKPKPYSYVRKLIVELLRIKNTSHVEFRGFIFTRQKHFYMLDENYQITKDVKKWSGIIKYSGQYNINISKDGFKTEIEVREKDFY